MFNEKVYFLFREDGNPVVELFGRRRLSPKPSQKFVNHSPTGFEWGYSGSGPAQLALAILMHYTRRKRYAFKHHQAFKDHFLANRRRDEWFQINASEIDEFLKNQEAKGNHATTIR